MEKLLSANVMLKDDIAFFTFSASTEKVWTKSPTAWVNVDVLESGELHSIEIIGLDKQTLREATAGLIDLGISKETIAQMASVIEAATKPLAA